MLNNNGLFSLAYAMLKPSWNSSLHFHLLSWLSTIIVFSHITFYSPLIIFFTTPWFLFISTTWAYVLSSLTLKALLYFTFFVPYLQPPVGLMWLCLLFFKYLGIYSCSSLCFQCICCLVVFPTTFHFSPLRTSQIHIFPPEFLLLATKISHTLPQG